MSRPERDASEGRRERKRRETRDRLVAVTESLVAERGYDESSVEMIASGADVSRATFFNYFASKEDVVHAWTEHRRGLIAAGLASAEAHGAVDRLREGLRTVAAAYDADATTSRPMVRAWVRCGGPLRADADDTASLLRGTIAAGQETGQITTEVEAEVAAKVLLDVYLGTLVRWATSGGSLRSELAAPLELALAALVPRGRGQ